METHPDRAAAEIKRLQRCINDLISVVALPAVWAGREPPEIVRTLLDVLLGMLDLDFAYARLEDSIGKQAVEMASISQSSKLPRRPEELGELLKNWLGPSPQNWDPLLRNSNGGGDISIVPMRLGLQGDIGVVAVGARRPEFPGPTERLVLSVAANQAAIGLQEARLLAEQKRVASELDRRVMQRTAELAAANEELTKEVAERARAQEVLHATESNLRQIVDSIPGLVCTMSPAGEIEHLNRQVREYFGKTTEELKGWAIGDAVHPDDLPRVVAAHMHSITNGIPYDIEHRCRRADGVYRWFQVRALPVRDPDGQITGWYVLLTDIDDRKRLEDAVRSSERNLNEIISTIPALAWSASPDGAADFFNQHYLDYLGLTLHEARGWGWSTAVHTDDLSGLVATWQVISASGKAGEAEARLRRFDGQYRWFLFRVNPASDESGSIIKWYGVNTDIEDRKRIERLQAEFARAARISMLGEIAASIAHEVNQPLAAMRTNGETALRWLDRAEPNVAKARELMLLNVEAARRATDIIARIRAMAAGRVPEHTELSLHDVIEESIVFLRSELQSNAVSVTVDLTPTRTRVIGDRIQLQQVIVNLTMNAAHAMAKSPSTDRTLLIRTRLTGAEMLSCTFEDSGPGIDPFYLDRLFDSFFTTKDAGMGMGLPVSRSIIEAHGGVIKADNNSELGGARFSFALPVENPIAR